MCKSLFFLNTAALHNTRLTAAFPTCPSLSPWQTPLDYLLLGVWLCIHPISGIMSFLSLCNWSILLNAVSSRFTCWKPHQDFLIIESSINRTLISWFHFFLCIYPLMGFSVVNNTPVNTPMFQDFDFSYLVENFQRWVFWIIWWFFFLEKCIF